MNIRKNWIFIVIPFLLSFSIGITIGLVQAYKDNQQKQDLINSFMSIQKFSSTREQDCYKDFCYKCLLARQVYQWSFFLSTPTKIGNLQLTKVYAMDNEEFQRVIDLSWKLNRELNIPLDSEQNFMMFSKWIMESGLCPFIEHKTGEVVKFSGYTRKGMMWALYYYKYQSHITKGSPFYIPELFQEGLTEEQIIRIFNNIDNVIKFDYAYLQYLLGLYNWDWSWALTAFHFGQDKTDYWWGIGLRQIPEFRLDGHWQGEFLRNYSMAIEEIAFGISQANNQRMSRYEYVIGLSTKCNESYQKYIDVLRLKVRAVQGMEQLQRKYDDLKDSYTNFKRLNTVLWEKSAELNDINLDRGKGKDIKNILIKTYNKIRGLK